MTTPTNLEAETPNETDFKVEQDKPRAWYDGNLSLWLLVGAVLGLWFTCYKGFGILFGLLPTNSGLQMGPFFAIHLVTCALFMAICIYNIFHTPSHGNSYRAVHIVLGRMAMIAGLISFVSGAVTAWWERYTGQLGFAIGITAGGCFQVSAQLYGWYQIRYKRDIQQHKLAMLFAFYLGCLVPMWMRIMPMIGGGDNAHSTWASPTAAVIGIVFGLFGARAAVNNRFI